MRSNHILVVHNFCPCCYSGQQLGTSMISELDPRIDQLQLACARIFKSNMRVLDLTKPGEKCARNCSVICLVCGQAIFESNALKLGDSREVLKNEGAVLACCWRSPIHARCAKKGLNQPNCYMPKLADTCPVHACGLAEFDPDRICEDQLAVAEPITEPVTKQTVEPAVVKPAVKPGSAWSGLMSKMKPDAPRVKPGSARGKPKVIPQKRPAWEEENKTGYFMTKDGLVYKHADGRVTHGVSGCDKLEA